MKFGGLKSVSKFFSQHPRLRVFAIFVVIIVVVIYFIKGLTAPGPSSNLGDSSVSTGSSSSSSSTHYTAKHYQSLAAKKSAQDLAQAEQTGQTYISDQQQAQLAQQAQASQMTPAEQRVETLTRSKIYADMVKRQKEQAAYAKTNHIRLEGGGSSGDQQRQYQLEQMKLQAAAAKASEMQAQLGNLTNSWQVSVQKVSVGSNKGGAGAAGGGALGSGAVMIKAGTIYFAVLDTQLNSDQPGTPVMATIIQGKFKGAKLLGEFKREDEKLVVSFSKLSSNGLSHSISISAYAIDSKTAQNALASDVDHHYLLRYGSLFAAGFLQGFGEYFSNNANGCSGTQNCYVFGNSQTQQTTRKAMYSGLGQVGSNLSSKASSEFDRPPTVTLNQGVGLGILFMNDVTDSSLNAGASS